MKAFNNYNEAAKAASYQGGEKLPAGAYVCKVKGVRYEDGTNGNSDRIAIQFDIAEGDYKDFFKNQYENNTNEDKKYKGIVRIYVPVDDGSEKDDWTKRSFAGWTTSFEASNKGYAWDWDESKWKNKLVGIVFGETGTVIEGKERVYTEARFAIPVDDVRSGKAPQAKFKAKNGYGSNPSAAAPSDTSFMNIPDSLEEEIPFN